MVELTMAEREMTRRIGELVAERDEIRALLLSVVSDLNNIASEIIEEEDRTYFGSSNDADHFKAVAEKLNDWRFDQ